MKLAGVELDPGLLRGKRILLAEDNDLNAEIAMEILKEAGFEVDRVQDDQAAVEMVERADLGYYHLALMDIQMPRRMGMRQPAASEQCRMPAKPPCPSLR